MSTEWKDVLGCPSYQVSRQGDVRKIEGDVFICKNRSEGTYGGVSYVAFRAHNEQGQEVTKKVHICVLEAFVSPRPDGMDACHYDGNRLNNRLSNLRWDTRSNNHKDTVRHGKNPFTKMVGENSPIARLTDKDVLWIRANHVKGCGKLGQNGLAKKYGVAPRAIECIVKNITWKHLLAVNHD